MAKIHDAAKRGDVERVRRLLARSWWPIGRATVNQKENKSGWLPIHAAASGNQLGATRALLELGADINSDLNARRWTPLHYAAEGGHAELTQFLLGHGADANAAGGTGDTPAHLAAEKGHLRVVELLLRHGVSTDERNRDEKTALHKAAAADHVEVVKCLIEHGASVQGWGERVVPPLYWALLGNGGTDVIRALIKSGADINEANATTHWEAPLHVAVRRGDIELVRLLMQFGADINIQGPNNWTPLHYAASADRDRIESFYAALPGSMQADCKVLAGIANAVENSQLRSLDVAAVLIELGAHINAVTRQGWTPLRLAELKNHPRMVALLRAHGSD